MGLDWLRRHRPSARTSTYDPRSQNARDGEAAELRARDALRRVVRDSGVELDVDWWQDVRHRPLDLGPVPVSLSYREAIGNSLNGDVYVIDRTGWVLFSVEVKYSGSYPSVSMSDHEVMSSCARYLIGDTLAGVWGCTMEDARRAARLHDDGYRRFWVIHPLDVRTMTLEEIIKDGSRVHRTPAREDLPL